jgi:predicted RNA-binding Zn-ribbon protein involved in translation (DUF1610 family)
MPAEHNMTETFICRKCGQIGPHELNKKGKLSTEIILWLLFILPGLIYSIWRRTGRYFACRACGTHHIVPLDSELGREVLKGKGPSPAELVDDL